MDGLWEAQQEAIAEYDHNKRVAVAEALYNEFFAVGCEDPKFANALNSEIRRFMTLADIAIKAYKEA